MDFLQFLFLYLSLLSLSILDPFFVIFLTNMLFQLWYCLCSGNLYCWGLSHYWPWFCISRRYSYLYLNLKESMIPASVQPSTFYHLEGTQNYDKSKLPLHIFWKEYVCWAPQDGWNARFPEARIIAYVTHLILPVSILHTYAEAWKHLSGLKQEILLFPSLIVPFSEDCMSLVYSTLPSNILMLQTPLCCNLPTVSILQLSSSDTSLWLAEKNYLPLMAYVLMSDSSQLDNSGCSPYLRESY